MGITAGITAGVSLLSSMSASKTAGKNTKYQRRIAQQQAAIAGEQWDRYLDIYGPVEEALGEEVQQGPDYARASADAALAFDKSQGVMDRRISRYGIDPTSGRFEDMGQEYGIQRARGQVDSMNREDDKQFARKLAFTQTGRGLPSTALSGLSSASQAYGNIASMYSKQAASAGGAAGYMAGKAMDYYGGGNQNTGYGMDTSFPDYSYPAGSGTVLQN